MPNKPQAKQAINSANGKSSHIVLKRKTPFPEVYNPGRPKVGTIYDVSVKDDDNHPAITFSASIVPPEQGGANKQLGIRIKTTRATDDRVRAESFAGDLADGLLTVTLNIVTQLSPLVTSPTELPVSDVPVDYISDPDGC